jgi:hypothetical protein
MLSQYFAALAGAGRQVRRVQSAFERLKGAAARNAVTGDGYSRGSTDLVICSRVD